MSVGSAVSAVILQDLFGFSVADLLTNVVFYAFWILFGFILAWVLISWLPGYPSTPFFQAVYDAVRAVVDPIMAPLRARLPKLSLGGFALDLSPIIAIFGLFIARELLTIIINQFIRPITG